MQIRPPHRLSAAPVALGIALLQGCTTPNAPTAPSLTDAPAAPSLTDAPAVDGITPALTAFNQHRECGVGAVVAHADRLWWITYAPHEPSGSTDKLYSLDAKGNFTIHGDVSVGGTPAGRLIHRETNQLFIGPYVIDADANIRALQPDDMPGRITAYARDLTEPADYVLCFTMEEGLYRVNVHDLAITDINRDTAFGGEDLIHGYHGKGAYTGQGRLVVANNGLRGRDAHGYNPTLPSGALASFDGDTWTELHRDQHTEVTGPGGIFGNAFDADPVWALGWDHKSVLLEALVDGEWQRFRLPKGTNTYDGQHGWHTEWPRIRSTNDADPDARLLLDHHGILYDFPRDFGAHPAAAMTPVARHLTMISDWQRWNDQLVFGCNHVSVFDNGIANQAQSNLMAVTPGAWTRWGAPSGWATVWRDEDLGPASDAYLGPQGYEHVTVYATRENAGSVLIQSGHDGAWTDVATLRFEGGELLTADVTDAPGPWLRLVPSIPRTGQPGKATATITYLAARDASADDPAVFAGLADIDSDTPATLGIVRPRGNDTGTLQLVTADTMHLMDAGLTLSDSDDDSAAAWTRSNFPLDEPDFTLDDASVIMTTPAGDRYRLPRTHAAYDEPFDDGQGGSLWPRGYREVVTERGMLNVHGTFYEIPRDNSGGLAKIQPVATHGKRIADYCTWRGLLVLAGCTTDATADAHTRVAPDGGAVWVGSIERMWQMGKPVGYGGPWLDTPVAAGEPSDPYLFVGYDRKTITLEHDAETPVTITVQVDLTGDGDWAAYSAFPVSAGEPVEHTFPPGFTARWVRVVADADTTATAQLRYE